MNKDIRLSTDWREDPRFVDLESRLGAEGLVAQLTFWTWAAKHRSKGIFTGMDARDIAKAARWEGDAIALLRALRASGFVGGTKGSYILVDWEKDQDWASHDEDRTRIAKENGRKKWSMRANNLTNAPSPLPSPYPNPPPLQERRSKSSPEKIEDTVNSLVQAQPKAPRPSKQPALPVERQIESMIAELENKPSRTPSEQADLEGLLQQLKKCRGSAS